MRQMFLFLFRRLNRRLRTAVSVIHTRARCALITTKNPFCRDSYPLWERLCKHLLSTLVLLSTAQLEGIEWSAPIPIARSSASIYIPQVYHPSLNRIFAAWVDADTHLILCATYGNGVPWSEPSIVDLRATSSTSPALCYDACNHTMVLAWSDLESGFPMYSIYTQEGWSSPQTISTTQQCCVPIGLSVTDRGIVATWMNHRNHFLPIYAIYKNGSWNSASEISTDLRYRAHGSVVSSYDAARKQVIAVWGNYSSSFPQYAIYKEETWTIPEEITPFSEVTNSCAIIYDEENAQTIAAWSDANDRNLPTYAIHNGSSWIATHRTITGASSVESDIQLLYHSDAKAVLASWGDHLSFAPIYAIFKRHRWSHPITISAESGVIGSPTLCFDNGARKTLAMWIANESTMAPTYSIEQMSETPRVIYHIETNSSLPGVTNLRCKQQKHHFGFMTEYYNTLSWTASLSPKIVGYHIYRNRMRIASVPSDVFKYQDHNQQKRSFTTYTITAFDNLGHESQSATITVKKK